MSVQDSNKLFINAETLSKMKENIVTLEMIFWIDHFLLKRQALWFDLFCLSPVHLLTNCSNFFLQDAKVQVYYLGKLEPKVLHKKPEGDSLKKCIYIILDLFVVVYFIFLFLK